MKDVDEEEMANRQAESLVDTEDLAADTAAAAATDAAVRTNHTHEIRGFVTDARCWHGWGW